MGNKRHEDWREQVERFQDSGMTQQCWCDATGTNLHNLRYWLRKVRNIELTKSLHEQTATWMPLQIIEGPFKPTHKMANDGRIIGKRQRNHTYNSSDGQVIILSRGSRPLRYRSHHRIFL